MFNSSDDAVTVIILAAQTAVRFAVAAGPLISRLACTARILAVRAGAAGTAGTICTFTVINGIVTARFIRPITCFTTVSRLRIGTSSRVRSTVSGRTALATGLFLVAG